MPRKDMNKIEEPQIVVGEYTFEGLTREEAQNLFRKMNQGWEKDTPANLPTELQSYTDAAGHNSDRFFSPLRQLFYAEERKMQEEDQNGHS